MTDSAASFSDCPRCEGQKYDRGSCSLCGNVGWLCRCGGRVKRSPIYYDGHPTYDCTECGIGIIDDSTSVAEGKLIPLWRSK